MKYHIEKNTIQETLVIPLYARALCTRRFPHLFSDPLSVELLEQLDYDFSALERTSGSLMQTFGAMEAVMRQSDLAWEVRDYLADHPQAAVVNLGCGLDQTGRSCDNGQCRLYNIDLPDVMAVREALLPAGEREKNLTADLNDLSWFDAIDTPLEDGAVFFAAGVFYYFRTEQVQALCAAMAERFPGGRLVFDAAGPTAVKLMLKTWVKQAGIRDVGGVLLRPGCGKRIACLVGSHLCIQPGLYAGLPGFAGAGGSLHPPPSGQGCRWAAEAADCANGVPKVPRWSPT